MTRDEFKLEVEKKLVLLNEAKRLFPLIFDVLKNMMESVLVIKLKKK